ncbi:hypothetical protein CDD83_10840 [Cordyceps sp. RAO-2017]|nr:hypothetical protein CDD83_10840 [Cordyceps sp. RAO-2017]
MPVRRDISSTSDAALSLPTGESQATRPTAMTSAVPWLAALPKAESSSPWCSCTRAANSSMRSSSISLASDSFTASGRYAIFFWSDAAVSLMRGSV